MNSATQRAVAPVAIRIRPLLNRLVFHGLDACRGVFDDARFRVRAMEHAPSRMPVITTVGLDRIGADLAAAGMQRAARTATYEDWTCDATMTLRLEPADPGGPSDSDAAVVREYAVLLTRAVLVTPELSVRVPSVVAQLALLWTGHQASRLPFSESTEVEDLVELVLRRSSIVDDVIAAPEELRRIVARAMRTFLADESSRWALRRALPDGRHVPGVVTQAIARIRTIAETGAI